MGPHIGTSGSSSVTVKNETSYKSPPSSVSDLSQPECEPVRGRRQDRESTSTAKAEDESEDDREVDGTHGKPRKRKRSRKGLEKSFPCTFESCGKSYSRAEHLYRHQLNHEPKQIYECNFPGCGKQFVRQDLCARHRERHTARGSHLQRKDPYLQGNDGRPTLPSPTAGRSHFDPLFRPLSATDGTPSSIPRSSTTPLASPHGTSSLPSHSPLPGRMNGLQSHRSSHSSVVGDQTPPLQTHIIPRSTDYGHSSQLQRSNSDDQHYAHAASRCYESKTPVDQINVPRYDPNVRNGNLDSIAPLHSQQFFLSNTHSRSSTLPGPGSWRSSPTSYASSTAHHSSFSAQFSDGHGPTGHHRQQDFPPMLPLPPPVYPAASQISVPADRSSYATANNPQPSIEMHSGPDMMNSIGFDQLPPAVQSAPYSTQGFEAEAHDRSPYTLPEDFTTWLFNDPQLSLSPPEGQRQGSMSLGATLFMDESVNTSCHARGPYDDIINDQFDGLVPQHPMSVTSIVDPAQTEAIISEEKWKQLLDLIETRFNETDPAAQEQKDDLLKGNCDESYHVLSLPMMQTYIRSYWYHFHPQMPILHKPTFSANKAQNLLIIAIIAIGASCLDKLHGHKMTQAGADLSSFLAWHLRGEIFKDRDFIAPAELWVLQALVLLEIYEKMYSTRLLHERAHIHHATTLTLMRRGNSLIGRSALDSPPAGTVDRSSSTNETRKQSHSHTPDQWWNHWIKNEATRRVAFAAFIIDSVHSNMFGHTATMVAHEMRMQLPCDESLWSATSSAEVGRIENMLKASGSKPITFFDGLKNTLNNKFVRTNSFGRTALMAGLLSVSWHMRQRDLQVRSLGALKPVGAKDTWRGTLTKAFDFWKSDFEQSYNNSNLGSLPSGYQAVGKIEEENIFESRTVLHHLAHMATHVDIVSCQIFARAKRLLGRTTLPSDYTNHSRRIREQWAPKPSARDATFYALKFLAQVLTPDTAGLKRSLSEAGMGGPTAYSARDDFLINRPWVVYVAALIVWSYGYALDGPIKTPPNLTSLDQQTYDMRLFLERVGGVEAPDDLIVTPDRNACMGMLYILRTMFDKCRWELLREGAKLLTNCIEMLRGQDV
ncbi:MAG: hypothetical protein LQ343_000848 [Gyalolechia ehrenbergii]|nr:MAG: hypothetical protein LQ343_000848 [Gyalolechia ehrenbergii]